MSKLLIYRILQEALMNIHKHSKATRLWVKAKKNKRDVSFIIKDNGKGFDLQQVDSKDPHKSGLGLTSMRERVRMLDGRLEIGTVLSQGTKIAFTVPLKKGAIDDEPLSSRLG